jgi:hypothetical protein
MEQLAAAVLFKDIYYARTANQLYIFDSQWESFRPIENIGWDGSSFKPVDEKYKQNLFDRFYGFGTEQCMNTCKKMNVIIEFGKVPELFRTYDEFWKWASHAKNTSAPAWIYDRKIVLHHAITEPNPTVWKNYLKHNNLKQKTLRNNFKR